MSLQVPARLMEAAEEVIAELTAELDAALAQVAALREAVRRLAGCRDDGHSGECESCALLADTEAAASAFVARIRAEDRIHTAVYGYGLELEDR